MTIHDAAKVGRPIAQELNRAQSAARRQLAVNHAEEYESLVSEHMAAAGYERTTQTIVKTKWTQNGAQ